MANPLSVQGSSPGFKKKTIGPGWLGQELIGSDKVVQAILYHS